ncbi:MAG TPA: sulfite exporter TauE/SafE family protein [Candidatus Competibacteraceae bacterium]|nr:sulfite exporter TauE/SafE family protein [Candidatus Competibacteraceae bacterium]
MLSGWQFLLVGLAALAGGAVNALAGGGTLLTFPMLTAMGVPAVAANVTNTVALCPGYLSASFAQAGDLQGQRRRLGLLLPASIIGGIIGGILLLHTGEKAFRALVPFLILLAAGLLAVQDRLRGWLLGHADRPQTGSAGETWTVLPITLAAVYGGYFGAGVSVIVLAVLGLVLSDSLTRLNALKQVIALGSNTAAAIFFLFSGQVVWSVALVMAAGALAGGALGGRLAGRIEPAVLRRIVIIIGVVVALIYLW